LRLRGGRTGGGESCDCDHDTAGHWHVAAFPLRGRGLKSAIRNNGEDANTDHGSARRRRSASTS
jgi:hypothetical protein